MQLKQIEAMQLVVSGLVLTEFARRGGRRVIVDRYMEAATGQMFDVVAEKDVYRETPVPKDDWDIVPFGEWKQLAP